jgi:8-oxo-dGTP pyrophosphatase MutT (NUDIX family)
MKQCSRAIVLKGNNILLMKRFKMGKVYYTLLGGGVNPNETPEAAAIREVSEESGLVIGNPRCMFIEEAGLPFGTQHVFLCDLLSDGEPALPAGSEEAFWSVEGKNTYEPIWFPFAELETLQFVSPLLQQALVEARSKGWPEKPRMFSTQHSVRLS